MHDGLVKVGGEYQFDGTNLTSPSPTREVLNSINNGDDDTIRAQCKKSETLLQNAGFDALNATVTAIALFCVPESSGKITRNREWITLTGGQRYLSIDIKGWPWSREGQFLEFHFIITVPSGNKISIDNAANGSIRIYLGIEDYVEISSRVSIYYDTIRYKCLTWTQKLSIQLNLAHVARKSIKRN